MRRELVNEFSWSKSRHGKFEECQRLYWYHYYGAWGGWDAAAPSEVREAYVLKNLSTRQQWAGKVVHDTVAFALSLARAGEAPTLESAIARTRAKMRDDFARSRRFEYRERPKKVVGLVEHEYAEPVSDAEWKANWENSEACLRSFYSSSWLAKARTLRPQEWLPIDEIDSFLLDGIKVFAGPDFAFRDGERTVLVDWKTGAPREEDREQVKGYALFAAAKWNATPSQVVARLVYLSRGEEIDVNVEPAALDEFKVAFRTSVGEMKSRLRDPERNLGLKDDFPMTEQVSRCRGCAFRRCCSRAGSGAQTQAA